MMRRTHDGRSGTVLISGTIALVLIAGLAAALFTTVMVENDSATLNARTTTGQFLADGGSEICEKLILRGLAQYNPVEPTGGFEITGNEVTYTIELAGASRVLEDDDGIHTLVQPVLVSTRAAPQGYGSTVKRVIEVARTPIFQFAVFYDKDLEILPGPNMTLRGRVHSNRDIYLGSGGTLTIDSGYLRAVGDIYRLRKNDGSDSTGTVNVRVSGSDSFATMESWYQLRDMGIPSTSGFDSNFTGYDANGDGDYLDPGELSPWVIEAMERWNGTVRTAEHGMRELVPPTVKSIQRYVKAEGGDYERDPSSGNYYPVDPGTGSYDQGFYHRRADLVILDTGVCDGDGNAVELLPGTIQEVEFYDAREKKHVTVTEIDLTLLAESGRWPMNGLLYAARNDAKAGQPNGVRLKNGRELAGGLTVASEGPVYTLGNYNSRNKKPAAIMCDAYNLLSNSWDDSKSPGSLPKASQTAVAAAIVTGSYDTTLGNYNGGFENLVRFHENWTGVQSIIRGSFVDIYDSQIATGHWVYGGDVYTAPNRNWDYDSDFNDVSNLPPFTPMVNFIRGVAWFDRAP